MSVFAVHEVPNPAGYALAADIFHGHAADARQNQNEFHGKFVFEARQFVGDFAVPQAIRCKFSVAQVADGFFALDFFQSEDAFAHVV